MIRDADAATHAPPASAAPRAALRAGRPDALVLLLAFGVLLYAGFLGLHMGAYAGGSDSSGYLNSARLLKFGETRVAPRSLPGLPASELPPFAYAPLGFVPQPSGDLVPTYPIGLPLFLAGAALVTGWEAAAPWVMWFHALAGVALMYLLSRHTGLPAGWSAVGASLLALCPLYLLFSLQLMSDVPATAWAIATILFASLSRQRDRWALAAGCALGLAVLIRPTNILLAVPAAIALGAGRRRWGLLIAGGALPAAAQLFYNQVVYGNPLTSGYGAIGALFSWAHVPVTLAHYGEWLPVLLTPLGLLALGLPFCARAHPRWSALLAAWLLPCAGFYAAYYHTHETWWYLRFLLPAFPAVWIAALLVLRVAWRRAGISRFAPDGSRRAWAIGIVATVAIAAFATHWNRHFNIRHAGGEERVYPESIEWMKDNIPENAVILAMQTSGALFHYTSFPIIRWDQIGAADYDKIARAARAQGRPLCALLFPFEEERLLRATPLPARWTKIGAFKHVGLWRAEPHAAP